MSHKTSTTLQALSNFLHACSVQGFLCLTRLYLKCKWNPQLNSSLLFYIPAAFHQLRLLHSHFAVWFEELVSFLSFGVVSVVWPSVCSMLVDVLLEYKSKISFKSLLVTCCRPRSSGESWSQYGTMPWLNSHSGLFNSPVYETWVLMPTSFPGTSICSALGCSKELCRCCVQQGQGTRNCSGGCHCWMSGLI